MIVIRYDLPIFARFYSGFSDKYPLQFAQEADDRDHLTRKRKILDARLVRPPLSGNGYCVDCLRRIDSEDLGMSHHGHLIDIRNMQFNTTEVHSNA